MLTMAGSFPKQPWLTEAFSIVEHTEDMDGVVSKLRDFLTVDHVVYYSTKLEAPTVPYIRLTYPASWVKRYLQMGYGEVDLVLREGFKRTLPFEWKELEFTSPAAVTVTPADRSNSPPIISIPTPTATMPMVEAWYSTVKNESAVLNDGATTRKKMKITIAATSAPISGRASSRFDRPRVTRLEDSAGADGGAALVL